MSKKREHPMQWDSLRVFADPSDTHTKVVLSLAKKNYKPAEIAKATGLPESIVRKIMRDKGLRVE